MWLFTRYGLFSIVQDTSARGEQMLVRARRREHLEALITFLTDTWVRAGRLAEAEWGEIIETPDADYRWRITVSRSWLKHMFITLAGDITYGNFKAEVKRARASDKRYYRLLENVHAEGYDKLQRR